MNVRKVIMAGAAAMALAILGLPAHAQFGGAGTSPSYGWNSSTMGNQTFYSGTGGNTGWRGNTSTMGNQSFSTFNGPNGQTQRCTTSRMGFQTYTNCN